MVVVAPAGKGMVGPKPTGVVAREVPARTDLEEGTRWRTGLALVVRAPADHAVVGRDAAGVELARTDLEEGA
jgi:hypothetical protein